MTQSCVLNHYNMVHKNCDTVQGKARSWMEHMYKALESVCVEVDKDSSHFFQETTKYVEAQMNSVGTNVRKLCAELIQDLLPPPYVTVDPDSKKFDSPTMTYICEQVDTGKDVLKKDHKMEVTSISGSKIVVTAEDAEVNIDIGKNENRTSMASKATQLDSSNIVQTQSKEMGSFQGASSDNVVAPPIVDFETLLFDRNSNLHLEGEQPRESSMQLKSVHAEEANSYKESREDFSFFDEVPKDVEHFDEDMCGRRALYTVNKCGANIVICPESGDSSKESMKVMPMAVQQEEEVEQCAHWLVREDQLCRDEFCVPQLDDDCPMDDYEAEWELL